MQNFHQNQVVLRMRDVVAMTGLSRSCIYTKIDPKSKWHDPAFPKSFKLSNKSSTNGAIGFYAEDVHKWINSCRMK